MAHVGQEAAFEFCGLSQLVGLYVQLGIKGNDAAIGLFQFRAQVVRLLSAESQLRCEVLGSWFVG